MQNKKGASETTAQLGALGRFLAPFLFFGWVWPYITFRILNAVGNEYERATLNCVGGYIMFIGFTFLGNIMGYMLGRVWAINKHTHPDQHRSRLKHSLGWSIPFAFFSWFSVVSSIMHQFETAATLSEQVSLFLVPVPILCWFGWSSSRLFAK